MKRVLCVLIALVMSLLFAACLAEENEGKVNEAVGMPNPVVEYDSLEEINAMIGVNLMHPSLADVTNERFSVINNAIAQYACEINGMEWTFRSAYITDEDISGMHSEYNEFSPNQDFGLYTNEFYLERFFDGDRQYTIVAENPISEDGEVYLSEDVFMDVYMELQSIQKQHIDDTLVGDYQDTVSQRATAYVERHGDVYNISVNWSDSASELSCWTMYDAVRENDKLSYRGEEIGRYTYDEEGNTISSDLTMSNNLGFFEIKNDMLYWIGASQEECRSCIFEKIVYTE